MDTGSFLEVSYGVLKINMTIKYHEMSEENVNGGTKAC